MWTGWIKKWTRGHPYSSRKIVHTNTSRSGSASITTFLEAVGVGDFETGGRETLLFTASCLTSCSGEPLPSRWVLWRGLGRGISEWSVRSGLLPLVNDIWEVRINFLVESYKGAEEVTRQVNHKFITSIDYDTYHACQHITVDFNVWYFFITYQSYSLAGIMSR